MMSAWKNVISEARHNRHRVLLLLSGSHAWCTRVASAWYAQAESRVWLGETAHPDAIAMSKAKQLLGSEYALAVVDAHAGLSPNVLAAVCGTVVAGGVLVLLVPPWYSWGAQPDEDYARMASYPQVWSSLSSHFLMRLRNSLNVFISTQTVCVHWREKNFDSSFNGGADAISGGLFLPAVTNVAGENTPTSHQKKCLKDLQNHAGISVLLADRGHGKSALLGFAAQAWMAQKKKVLLIAPSRAAAASVFRHAGDGLLFAAPDAVLADDTLRADVLLIDEAAAIPLSMLLAMLQRFPYAVLATTTDGYEGTGRGFVLRFLRELDKQYPAWQRLSLAAPVRWAGDDPVSQWLYDVLLLDAKEAVIEPSCDISAVQFECVSQQQLAENEALLADVYGLLRSAHYRTTPDDLRFLLDASQIHIYRLTLDAHTLAVAMVVEEGNFDAAMAAAIAAGERRPRGHLLVQTLAVHSQRPEFLRQRVARVARIAVHTQYQTQGLGSRLLQAIVQRKKQEGFCALGSSFSAAPDVLRFWQKNGFELMRVGHRRQTASAEPSALVLRMLSDD